MVARAPTFKWKRRDEHLGAWRRRNRWLDRSDELHPALLQADETDVGLVDRGVDRRSKQFCLRHRSAAALKQAYIGIAHGIRRGTAHHVRVHRRHEIRIAQRKNLRHQLAHRLHADARIEKAQPDAHPVRMLFYGGSIERCTNDARRIAGAFTGTSIEPNTNVEKL